MIKIELTRSAAACRVRWSPHSPDLLEYKYLYKNVITVHSQVMTKCSIILQQNQQESLWRCLTSSSSLGRFCSSLGHKLHIIFWNALAGGEIR